jgi:hypothetical protein
MLYLIILSLLLFFSTVLILALKWILICLLFFVIIPIYIYIYVFLHLMFKNLYLTLFVWVCSQCLYYFPRVQRSFWQCQSFQSLVPTQVFWCLASVSRHYLHLANYLLVIILVIIVILEHLFGHFELVFYLSELLILFWNFLNTGFQVDFDVSAFLCHNPYTYMYFYI